MGIEISERVQRYIEQGSEDYILDFPKNGDEFVSFGGCYVKQTYDCEKYLSNIRLVLKNKPKWPASLSSLPIDGFEVGDKAVFLYSGELTCGSIEQEVLNMKEFNGFENEVLYRRSDCR